MCESEALLRTITEALMVMKIMILNPDASFAISSTGSNVIASAIAKLVPTMARCGVW